MVTGPVGTLTSSGGVRPIPATDVGDETRFGGGFRPPFTVTIHRELGGATIPALIFVAACYLVVTKLSFECSVTALAVTSPATATDTETIRTI